MKLLAVLALFALLAVQVFAHDSVLFTRLSVPAGWTRAEVSRPESRVHFHVAVTQQNLDKFNAVFNDITDLDSVNYGRFLSNQQIQSIVAPKPAHRAAVLDWLVSNGVSLDSISDFGDSIEVTTTAAIATKLFDAQMYDFVHQTSGKVISKAFGKVTVPAVVHDSVDMIFGLSDFPVPHLSNHMRRLSDNVGDYENDAIIPQSIWSLYNMPTNIPNGGASVSQGVIEWEGECFDPDDVTKYGTETSVTLTPPPANQIIGPNDPTQPGDESTLDIELIAGVNPSSSNWFWLEAGTSWLYGFTTHFLNTTSVPDVISISYSWYEGDQCEDGIGGAECQSLGVDSTGYVNRVNTEWQKIAMMGTSVVISSGDSGAHTRYDGGCSLPMLLAEFPPSSPYVTAVGATQVDNQVYFDSSEAPACNDPTTQYQCVKSGYELAVNVSHSFFTSGGGFSNISLQQSWQTDAINGYFKTSVPMPPASYYNAGGRGYPDVAAVGHNGFIIEGGYPALVGGTSQSAPTFAAIAALLSSEYKTITGNAIGFLNPLLYKAQAAQPNTFNDITVGDNICTEDGCAASCKGWYAAPGWDPVTGLGTPNYGNLLSYIKQFAHEVVARRANSELYTKPLAN